MSQVNHKYKIKIVEDMHDEYLENIMEEEYPFSSIYEEWED